MAASTDASKRRSFVEAMFGKRGDIMNGNGTMSFKESVTLSPWYGLDWLFGLFGLLLGYFILFFYYYLFNFVLGKSLENLASFLQRLFFI